MMRLFALAGFAFAVATSALAMPRATPGQADNLIIQVRQGCGIGMVLVNGQCVSRHDIRVDRRVKRRNYYGAYGTAGTAGITDDYCYRAWDSEARNMKSEQCARSTPTYVDTPGVRAIMRARESWGNGTWQEYALRSGITCTPGTTTTMGGQKHLCQ